jgi:DNA-binding MarR family transcriptional regulator
MLSAWRALLNARARVVDAAEAALADAGLPPLGWYDVLWPLYLAPGRRLRMGALAEVVVTQSRTGLTRAVDRLEREGLLRREPAPEDRRGSYVVLTRAGAALLRRMWPVYERVLDETFASGVRNPRALRTALERIAPAEATGASRDREAPKQVTERRSPRPRPSSPAAPGRRSEPPSKPARAR